MRLSLDCNEIEPGYTGGGQRFPVRTVILKFTPNTDTETPVLTRRGKYRSTSYHQNGSDYQQERLWLELIMFCEYLVVELFRSSLNRITKLIIFLLILWHGSCVFIIYITTSTRESALQARVACCRKRYSIYRGLRVVESRKSLLCG